MSNLVAVLIWLLLLAIVVGTSLLLWTRWGQYRPLAKCLGVSVLLHVVVLLFGSTWDLAQRLRQPEEETERRIWLETVETEALEEFPGIGGAAPMTEPWDYLAPGRELLSTDLDYARPQSEPTRQAMDAAVPDVRPMPEAPPFEGTEEPAVARREAAQRPTVSEGLRPEVPEVEASAPTQQRLSIDVPLDRPADLARQSPRRRSGERLPADAELGLPELRVEPHELSEPVARRAAREAREGSPAMAAELPLRPQVPQTDTQAPPQNELPRGLVTKDALLSRPSAGRSPQRQGRRGAEEPLPDESLRRLVAGESVRGTEEPTDAERPVARRETGDTAGDPVQTAASPRPQPVAAAEPKKAERREYGLPSASLERPRIASRASRAQRRADAFDPSRPSMPLPWDEEGAEAESLPVRVKADVVSVPVELRWRVSPARQEILLRRGGSPETEEAVEAALAWLAAHQSPDGRWDADGFTRQCPNVQPCGGEGTLTQADTALTGLALMAFLGAGHTHQSGKYASTVARGLRWLISQQRPDGDLRGDGRMYSHGIATIALCEAYALTRDPTLWEPAYRAAMFVVRAQNPATGGWRYQPRAVVGDTSVFGWQLLALRSAKLAGVPVPQETWERAAAWLPRVSWGQHGGLASYLERNLDRHGPTPPMTAEALACRLFLGQSPSDPAVQEAVDYLLQHLPEYRLRNVYYWYYGSLSLSQVGGDAWALWNERMKGVLLRTQRRSGHAKGSWDPAYNVAWDTVAGRIYTTALSTLCLEVYYRYAYEEGRVANGED